MVLEGYLWKRYSTCLGYRWHRRFFVLSSDYGGLLFILKHNQSKVAYNIFEFRDAPESFVAESDEERHDSTEADSRLCEPDAGRPLLPGNGRSPSH